MCSPKCVGGMGIIDLDVQNVCLLSKWLYKLINKDGVWQQLLKKKYPKNRTFSQVTKQPGDSQFWSGLMEVKTISSLGESFWLKMVDRQDFGRIGG